LEQAIEAEKRGQQRPDPQDCRADALQEVQIRSDAEGDRGNQGEKKGHADHRAAAGTDAEAKIAPEQGPHQIASASRSSPDAATPRGSWVAARIRPPPAR